MPSDSELETRRVRAIELARMAGDHALSFAGSELAVDRKADRSPVTQADREAEQLVRRALASSFPQDGCLGEEFGETTGKNAYRWIIDPIDGTKSFIAGVPLFGTLVALLRDEQPVIGVIYLPMLGDCLYAALGGGAWQVHRDERPRRAKVSSTPTLDDSLFLTTEIGGFSDAGAADAFQTLRDRCWVTRTWGDCYGYYLVATGRATLMIDPELNLWDAAPMLPILTESGGRYTDWQGQASVVTGSAVASNGRIHDEVLRILRPSPVA